MILVGDCVELMAAMPDASVDAVVTDPPYGLGFMGKEWDSIKQKASPAEAERAVVRDAGQLELL